MINPDTRYTKEFTISSFDVDAKKQASLQAILRYMQEIAALHAEDMKLGFHDMMKEKRAWVLAQLLVRLEKYPRFRDVITIKTWSNGPDGRYALRDFEINDAHGETVAKASSTWFVVDTEEMKICRLESYFQGYRYENINYALGRKPGRIKPFEVGDRETEFSANYSDLDINGHLNNVRYVDYMLDIFPAEFRLAHDIREIEMNFLKEAKIGDQLSNINKEGETESEYLHCLFNKDSANACFTARTLWD